MLYNPIPVVASLSKWLDGVSAIFCLPPVLQFVNIIVVIDGMRSRVFFSIEISNAFDIN